MAPFLKVPLLGTIPAFEPSPAGFQDERIRQAFTALSLIDY
jgi:hypothetical protein